MSEKELKKEIERLESERNMWRTVSQQMNKVYCGKCYQDYIDKKNITKNSICGYCGTKFLNLKEKKKR